MTKVVHIYRKYNSASVVVVENGADRIYLAIHTFNEGDPACIDQVSPAYALRIMEVEELDKEIKLELLELEDKK